jgi:hypothetical protein
MANYVRIVAVAGSEKDDRFVVVDFSDQASPVVTFVDSNFTGGCLVACSGNLAAVGSYQGSDVAMYDLTNPQAPAFLGLFPVALGVSGSYMGIGAVSLDGTNLLVGEYNGPSIVLLDVTLPPASAIVSTLVARDFTDGGVVSIAINGSYAAASGPSGFSILDYSTPGSPSEFPYVGNIEFHSPVLCDYDGSTVAVGDASGQVYTFTISGIGGPQLVAQSGSGSVTGSIAVMTGNVAVSNVGGIGTTIINFQDSPPSVSTTYLGKGTGEQLSGPVRLGFISTQTLIIGTDAGITWIDAADPNAPTLTSQAGTAVLATGLRPTLGFTAFSAPSGCLVGPIQLVANVVRGRARSRRRIHR